MKNIKRCFEVVKQYNLSNNPSSQMTQMASQKKKKIKTKQNMKLKFMKVKEQNLEIENS